MSEGPLSGYRFIEIAGVGPTQFCGMLLGDMGAEVIRVERIAKQELGVSIPPRFEILNRSRKSLAVDLKSPAGVEIVLQLIEQADALYEGFRPGVMEKLGLAPEVCMQRQEKLVYGRMTGWGQTGPLAKLAGHDPNYIALTGALDAIGERGGPPVLPLNLIGDYAGGGVYLALGMLAALLEAARSDKGQVVDCAMVDNVNSLMTLFHGLLAAGLWNEQRGSNVLDGGAHYFSVYRTKDEHYIVIGPIEERFYRLLLQKLEIDDPDFSDQSSTKNWPLLKDKLQKIFAEKTRAEWCDIFQDTDTCFSPVLSLKESPEHPHNRERENFVEVDGIVQPAPAPRFDRTPGRIQSPPVESGQNTQEVLLNCGYSESEVRDLIKQGIVYQSQS